MSTKPHQRIFALVLALLFLGTTVAVSAVVILQAHSESQANKTNASQGASKESKLEGTKLAGFTPVDKVDKVEFTDIEKGTGAEIKPGSTITFHYTGALAKDGTIFQSSHDTGQPITYPLSQLIKGWQEGIPGMKVGGKRRLFIPAAEGYGAQEQPGIPANSDLVFDIEVTATQ